MLGRLAEIFALKDRQDGEVDSQRVRLATCVLLLEIAHADKEFSDEEREHIEEALKRRFDLSRDEVQELIEVADEARKGSHDLWRFTNGINQGCTPAEKMEIIREVWRVVYVDNQLESHEDHLIHRMGTLLNLTHRQLIDQKMAVIGERGGRS